MHAVLIENPKAGRVAPGSLRVVERALEATFSLELVTTNARGHAAALARDAVEAGAKTVIAYGGDGTANEVVNGLLGAGTDTDVVLAVLPGGTTNVLARNFGFSGDLVEAAAHLIALVERGEPKRITAGRVFAEGEHGHLERVFAFAAGLVLDAETVRRVDRTKRRPQGNDALFVYNALRSFFALRRSHRPDLLLETPDGEREAFWACIAAADPFTYFRKRPFRVAPHAGEGPGIDVVASTQVRFWTTLRWVGQAMTSGKHIKHPDCIHLTDLPEVHVRARRPVPLQTDGEYLGEVTDVHAFAIPNALPVWA